MYEDTNGNGIQDQGEPGIGGVDVIITDSLGESQTVTTDDTGMYMAEVPAGPAVVDIDEGTLPPGYVQTGGTDPTTLNVPPGGTATDSDGFMKPTETPTASPTGSPTKSPTAIPTNSPTPAPTPKPTRKPTPSPTRAPTPKLCINATVTFDVDADGYPLAPGEYVEYEWAKYGLILSASGGVGDRPRLFDTENPRCENGSGGDPDLGAPNEGCTPSGAGIGEGGAPGTEGANCDPLGNVLIIQEPSADPDCPDDNKEGGMIIFDFVEPAVLVYEMGFLDIDELQSTVVVSHITEIGMMTTQFDISPLGNNSKQTLEINIKDVKQIKVTFPGSGAVAFIDFCYDPDTTPPPFNTRPPTTSPTASPTELPTASPTESPTASPTKSPTPSPTSSPTSLPTSSPTAPPTASPTTSPTASPTSAPTVSPTASPTESPTGVPTTSPTVSPTTRPTIVAMPSKAPVEGPAPTPVIQPTIVAIPSKAPVEAPTPGGVGPPSGAEPTPGGGLPPTCDEPIEITIDFMTTGTVANPGDPIPHGAYVEDEWKRFNLILSAVGGFGTLPRIFDTADVGNELYGDPDLGSPNFRCTPPGPGMGSGGEPGHPGENCDFLGNVLIIQENDTDTSIPDDNSDGGTITFDFHPIADYVTQMGLLDVDDNTTILVTQDDGTVATTLVPIYGDNSKQSVPINIANVRKMELVLERSATVIDITYAYTPEDCLTPTPSPSPVETPPPNEFPTIEMSMSMSMSMSL